MGEYVENGQITEREQAGRTGKRTEREQVENGKDIWVENWTARQGRVSKVGSGERGMAASVTSDIYKLGG